MDSRIEQLIQKYTNQAATALQNKLTMLIANLGPNPYGKRIIVDYISISKEELELLEKIYSTEVLFSSSNPGQDFSVYSLSFGKSSNQKIKELEAELERVKKKYNV